MQNSDLQSEQDLLDLIKNKVQESVELDFKEAGSLSGSEGKKKDIGKDVSSFANSAGGVILYGIVEDQSDHTASAIEGVSAATFSKERLEQVINSQVQPRIDGLRIQQIDLLSQKGKAVYVVTIPQSDRAPHQAGDKRYYKRFNFESVPMEDYEVKDVSRRLSSPKLDLQYFISPNTLTYNEESKEYESFSFNPTFINESPTPAHHAVVMVLIDERLVPEKKIDGAQEGPLRHFSFGKEKQFTVKPYSLNWGNMSHMPIFMDTRFRLFSEVPKLKISTSGRTLTQEFLFGHIILSPNMAKVKSFYLLSVDFIGNLSVRQLSDSDLVPVGDTYGTDDPVSK
ncbi:ATP-binding protein [Candidatus Woesebacteria bacterium]|nr:ATP-binding protein [Candidatus Woesebacteria bacterium]